MEREHRLRHDHSDGGQSGNGDVYYHEPAGRDRHNHGDLLR
jgi:hypothetical protein